MISEYSKILANFAAQDRAVSGGGVSATGTTASTEAGDAQQQQSQPQQQGQASAQSQEQAQRQGRAYSHLNLVPHQQQPGAPPSQIPTHTQPQSQHTPLQQHQQPPAQQFQLQQPQPSQQQQHPPVNHPAGQGGVSKLINMPVPQPPMGLTVHPVGCKDLTSQVSLPQRVAGGGFSNVYKATWKPSPQILHLVSIMYSSDIGIRFKQNFRLLSRYFIRPEKQTQMWRRSFRK